MAEFTVFYSWQSDLPRKCSRQVIAQALELAIEQIALDLTIEESPRLDHDTKSVSGTPEIAGTIFRKIENCGIFVADVSFVGETGPLHSGKSKKLISNPNVLIELGFAAGRIGWDRILLVMNTAFGEPEELIFDLRNRRFPITFRQEPDSNRNAKDVVSRLAIKLEEAIRAAISSEHLAVDDAISQLDMHAITWLKSKGHKQWFSVPPRTSMGDVVASQRLDDALIRLIELKLLQCDVSPDGRLYAYHWTYLGKQVLDRFGYIDPHSDANTHTIPKTEPKEPFGIILDLTAYDAIRDSKSVFRDNDNS